MDEPDNRRGDQGEQAKRVTIVLTHDLEALAPTIAMLDRYSSASPLPSLRALRLGQFSPRGLRCGVCTPSVPR